MNAPSTPPIAVLPNPMADDRARAWPWHFPVLLLGALGGAGVQVGQAQLWSPQWYGVLGLVGVVLLWVVWRARRWPVRRCAWCTSLLCALAAALLLFSVTGWRATQFAAQALNPALEGHDLRVTGMVTAMSQPLEGGQRLRLAVESATLAGQKVHLPQLIDVGWYHRPQHSSTEADTVVRPGERWQMTVRLKAPHGLRNPHGFDYELWAWEQDVQAVGDVRISKKDPAPQRLAATYQHPVEQIRQQVRDAIMLQLAAPKPADAADQRVAGVVAALVTGDQRAIERTDWDLFRTTGVSHLMSISGLHITLFAWLAAALMRGLWRRSSRLCLMVPAPSAALVGGALLAAAYALFSGWGIPAQRTISMLCAVALLRLWGLRWPWPQVWLLTCAAVVLPDPWALWQPGFWLSFVAVGILFASDPGAGASEAPSIVGRFLAMLREQWVVTLALTPLGLLMFGQVSLVGFVANLWAIPWVTLVVTPLAFLGVVWAPLWQLAGMAVQAMVVCLEWFAAVPWATLWLPIAPLWAGIAAVAGGALLALSWPWPVRLLGLPLLIPVFFWQPPRPAPGQFELLAVDVGQGSAVLVRTASRTLLYDAGPRTSTGSDAGSRVLVPLLRAQGEHLDTLLLSHRDSDHAGGAVAVLKAQSQAQLLGSVTAEPHLQALRPVTACVAGQRWHWDGVEFLVLHPSPVEPATAAVGARKALSSTNAQSCVLRIVAAKGVAALLPGDIETAQEQTLLAQHAVLRADVLLLPHHGSKTSSSAAFLDAVQPRSAWAQTGYRNRFGHPAAEVVDRLQERGITLVDSVRCGAAHWSSEQPDMVHCERALQPRYWQHLPP
ncbi:MULTISPECIES: DNA internalization-related competence protein ComEC/Rec2 [Giesbergeria]|uniref:DNA internalization-related competence protein ComEC/Rec2 n=1 Tax=Giesbergeria sinuosa TaxID=80883 RepID=A0ABV9QG45_9BURK